MKKTIIISALLAGSLSAYSQGTIVFNDHEADFEMHIYAPQVATPSVETTGNSTGDINGAVVGGATVYTGQLIGGTTTQSGLYNYSDGADYTVQLYAAGGLNIAAASLLPVTQYTTAIYSTTLAGAGLFKLLNLGSTDPGIPGTPTGVGTLALVAWYNGGTGQSLAAAQAAGDPWGMSPTANFSNLGNIGAPASTAPDMVGIQSFSLVTVPEPSTIALGVIGATTLLFRRRK